MGLNFYFGKQRDETPDDDPHGLRAFLFETLRELSDVAHTQTVGMNGHAQVLVRFPDDEVRRLSDSIRENVPPDRMKRFFYEIEAHERDVRAKLEHVNGSAGGIEGNILAISLRLNEAARALLVAAASGNDPLLRQDDFATDEYFATHDASDNRDDLDDWDDWLATHPEDAIVADEAEDGEDEPWKQSIQHWRPDEEGNDVPGEIDGMPLRTPRPGQIDPETEALILAEAELEPVNMEMVIASYEEMMDILEDTEHASGALELREEYHEVILAVMRHVSEHTNGNTNLECVALELRGPVVTDLMEGLNELERNGCVDSVFHNVAEAALMQVQSFSDMVNACSVGDDEENDAAMDVTLTLIQRLRERLLFE